MQPVDIACSQQAMTSFPREQEKDKSICQVLESVSETGVTAARCFKEGIEQ
jgi:hypothetical protein